MTADELIKKHYDLALKLARRYHAGVRGLIELDDLEGTALLALVETAHSQHSPKNTDFSKYVPQPIIMAMKIAVARQGGRAISGKKWKDVKRLRKLEDSEELSDEEICKKLNWRQDRLFTTRQALEALRPLERLDRPMTADEREITTVGDFIPSGEPEIIDVIIEAKETEELTEWAKKAVDELPKMAQLGVSLHFGLQVSKVKNVDVMDVLRLAVRPDATAGVRMLRKEVAAKNGKMAENSRGIPFGNPKSVYLYGGTEGKPLALKKWQRLTNETEETLPWYEPTRSVDNPQ